MNETSPDLPKPAQSADAPAQDRRRLLRAAATAAPLIATLPSGAALAVASTYQCVAQDAVLTARNLVPSTSLDQWVRFAAKRQQWRRTSDLHDEWAISFDSINWYRQDNGNLLNPARWTALGAPTDVAVLRIYSQATLELGNQTDQCVTSGDVGITTPPYSGCVFPIARQNIDDNMGITGSCMCSFS